MRKGMLIFTVGAIAVMAAGCAKDDAGKNIGGETTEVISTGTLETEKTVSTKDSAAIDNESTSDTKKMSVTVRVRRPRTDRNHGKSLMVDTMFRL